MLELGPGTLSNRMQSDTANNPLIRKKNKKDLTPGEIEAMNKSPNFIVLFCVCGS